ncbi:MAG TPA: hypothetical protein VEB68_12645 [Croceibacterium sp.]|nr:hypothetical protein [Croceibacterium sp.]
MRKLLIALAVLLGLSSAAWAQFEDLRNAAIVPGGRMLVRFDEAGNVSFTPDGGARLAEIDQRALRELGIRYDDPEQLAQSSGPNAAIIRSSDGSGPPPVERGLVRISLFAVTGRDGSPETLLVLENGYDQALRYRALMTRGRSNQPTDVCIVLPRLRGYEHWPYRIDRLDLRGFALVPYGEGTAPVCE